MRYINLLVLVTILSNLRAQDFDKLKVNVLLTDLTFDSDEEEKYFHQNENQKENLEIFFSINSTVNSANKKNFENKLSEVLGKYEGLSVNDKKFKKKLESCFKDIHNKFLVQYIENADFNNLIENGIYNCLSATALYALALQHLEIPFNIRKGDFHIYISAAPNTHNIVLESTLPEDGVIYFSKKFKQEFLKEMEKNKLLSTEDQQLSYEEKFEKYSHSDEVISIKQLVAYQYYNIGVQNINDLKFELASVFLEKSAYLHEDPIISLMLLSAITYQLPQGGPKNLDQGISPFVKLLNYSPELYDENFLPSLRTFMAESITNDNEETLEKVFAQLKGEVRDQKYMGLIQSEHNLCKSYFLSKEKKYEEAYQCIFQSYDFDSTRIDLDAIFADVLAREVQSCEDYLELNKTLKVKIDKYPVLTNYEFTKKTYLATCLIIAGDYYKINKPEKGIQYLDEFRQKSKLWDITKLKERGVGYAFGEASSYSVRQDNYKKARALLNEGLTFDLFSEELNRKLDTMNSSGY